jgi:hypothetical protein
LLFGPVLSVIPSVLLSRPAATQKLFTHTGGTNVAPFR